MEGGCVPCASLLPFWMPGGGGLLIWDVWHAMRVCAGRGCCWPLLVMDMAG